MLGTRLATLPYNLKSKQKEAGDHEEVCDEFVTSGVDGTDSDDHESECEGERASSD